MGFTQLVGLILFALDVWAIATILNTKVETSKKVLWIALVLLIPVIGVLIWYFAGPKSSK